VPTALITGATAGIGAAFARRLATGMYDLLLVARDAERLAAQAIELRRRHGIAVEALAADLTTDDGCATVERRLRADPVDLLVNSAGIGVNAPLLRSTLADQERLLRLNVYAVLRLTMAALPAMVDRRGGEIVNVSSVAGFAAALPGSTYPASKAWVTNFSQSVAAAVRHFDVRVLALCPGYTRTEFHQRAGIDASAVPRWMWLSADDVVEVGLRDLRRGRSISVPDWRYKVAVFGMRHLPVALLQRAGRRVRRTA